MFNIDPFVPAERESTVLRLAITGPSGSGKTRTALELAKRIAIAEGKPIAFLDTEGRSSLLYRTGFEFRALHLRNNFDPQQYVDAIEAAGRYGYGVLVIDSLSHAWNGEGGVLSIVDAASKKMQNNKFAGWGEGRPVQNRLANAIINTPVHLICTMRSKTAWDLQEGSGGKTKPVKIGLEPIQSDDLDYEFLLSFMLDMQHEMTVTKTRFDPYGIDHTLTLDDYDAFITEALAWVKTGVKAPVFGLSKPDVAATFARGHYDDGLNAEDLLSALGVSGLREFPGSVDEADELVAQYVERQRSAPPAVPTTYGKPNGTADGSGDTPEAVQSH